MTPATTTTSAVPTADAADQPLEYDRATVTGGVQVHRAADGPASLETIRAPRPAARTTEGLHDG